MQLLVLLLVIGIAAPSLAFLPPLPATATRTPGVMIGGHRTKQKTKPSSNKFCRPTSTALASLLDLPHDFFFVTFTSCGILLQVSKSFGRLRMEERAWEQRLEEGRRRRLEEDPTLTELDLRRQESAMEWSAYGKPRQEEEAYRKQMEQQRQQEEEYQTRGRGRNRVRVMERDLEDEDYDDDAEEIARQNRMTDEEIDRFEIEFGIDYDPYYDDPYTEDELPEGKRQVDKKYGDVIYEDGEIFYKDAQTGLYYRQGAKPRSMKFFG